MNIKIIFNLNQNKCTAVVSWGPGKVMQHPVLSQPQNEVHFYSFFYRYYFFLIIFITYPLSLFNIKIAIIVFNIIIIVINRPQQTQTEKLLKRGKSAATDLMWWDDHGSAGPAAGEACCGGVLGAYVVGINCW